MVALATEVVDVPVVPILRIRIAPEDWALSASKNIDDGAALTLDDATGTSSITVVPSRSPVRRRLSISAARAGY